LLKEMIIRKNIEIQDRTYVKNDTPSKVIRSRNPDILMEWWELGIKSFAISGQSSYALSVFPLSSLPHSAITPTLSCVQLSKFNYTYSCINFLELASSHLYSES